MRSATVRLFTTAVLPAAFSACTPSDDERCLEGYVFENNSCMEITEPIPIDTDHSDTDTSGGNRWLGAPCICKGEDCEYMGMPQFTKGQIIGCENVPNDWPGVELACMRSYSGELIPEIHFANGYCALESVRCEGDPSICQMTVVGDYQLMNECPRGAGLLFTHATLESMGMVATVYTKICVRSCTADKQCRSDETDPVFNNQPAGYQCVDKEGIGFCYDPRSLTEGYQVMPF